jgi:hypothetical protein
MKTTTKRKKSTAIRRFLALRTKTVSDKAKTALADFAKDVKGSPHMAVQWCESALALASQTDMLVAAKYRLDHSKGRSESQCIQDAIAWVNEALSLHARGGRSTSMFANAVKEAEMRGYAYALGDLEFVLEQGEDE